MCIRDSVERRQGAERRLGLIQVGHGLDRAAERHVRFLGQPGGNGLGLGLGLNQSALQLLAQVRKLVGELGDVYKRQAR